MKIVFTSCMDAERVADQAIWTRIAQQEQPDVLMLLGDQIYMDWGLGPGSRDWRSLIASHPDKGLRAFAVDMHRRYALQWGVASFRELVTGFAGRADSSRLLLTWDDHDYAWNNSLGVDGVGDAFEHGVPGRVKAVSRRLFTQFEQQLRHAPAHAAYPAMPPDWDQPWLAGAQDLFWAGALDGGEGPPCLLLDTRWHRQARSPGASLLGPDQAKALLDAVGDGGAGLIIVAAGTPMAHHYLLSQQAWHAEGGSSYREYDATLQAARRPVLFLGGDVHANVWGGRLPDTPLAGTGPSGLRRRVAWSPCRAPGAQAARWRCSFGHSRAAEPGRWIPPFPRCRSTPMTGHSPCKRRHKAGWTGWRTTSPWPCWLPVRGPALSRAAASWSSPAPSTM